MKQRITIEQLHELTEEQKGKLRGWWKPIEGDLCCNGTIVASLIKELPKDENNDHVWHVTEIRDIQHNVKCSYKPLPLLSIAQMIDFLQEHGEIDMDGHPIFFLRPIEIKKEFADTLWEAVKEGL